MGYLRIFCFLTVLFHAGLAPAKILFDLDLAYLQESRSSSSTSSRTGSFYSGGLLVDASGRERFYLGAFFAAGGTADSRSGSGEDRFSHQDVILGGRWFMDRQRLFSMSLGYGVISRADLKEAGSSSPEKWEGTSFYAKVGLSPEVRNWTFGVSLIYHQGNYTEKTVQGSTSSASLQRSMLWPSLSLGYRW